MPIYTYKCSSCGMSFEKFTTISRRSDPLEDPCPTCNSEKTLERAIQTTQIVSGLALKDKRPDGFREVLRGIKKSHPNGGMEV